VFVLIHASRWAFSALIAALALCVFASVGSAAETVNQCVACHVDGMKLKVLTQPDPPPAETGEG
jgi:uncharacterized protein YabE (DUF348 family)